MDHLPNSGQLLLVLSDTAILRQVKVLTVVFYHLKCQFCASGFCLLFFFSQHSLIAIKPHLLLLHIYYSLSRCQVSSTSGCKTRDCSLTRCVVFPTQPCLWPRSSVLDMTCRCLSGERRPKTMVGSWKILRQALVISSICSGAASLLSLIWLVIMGSVEKISPYNHEQENLKLT